MRKHIELAEATLDIVDGRADAEVSTDVGTTALTRFANSFIHQNVSEEATNVNLRVATAEGRVASSTSTASDIDDLRRFVDATIAAAGLQPVDGEWRGLGGPVDGTPVDHWDPATADADPMARARAVRAFVDAGQGLSAAGYCQTEARHTAYANTEGRSASGRYTTAIVDGIHQTGESAGSAHGAGQSLASIDAGALGARAAATAEAARRAFDTKPGDYQVVLSPECVATIAIFLSVYGFNAKMHAEGMSFVDVGATQFDSLIDIWDDATDPRGLFVGFDAEGSPKPRLDLVRGGVSSGLFHNRRTAGAAGTESTGHAMVGAEMWGPVGWNTFVGGGASSVDAMIAGVDRGIYVTAFNYCRVLDPKSLVVTGLTRNGTFLIENGSITEPVTNLRFTQSFAAARAPGAVVATGDDARFADSEFGPAMVHAPSMHLASWNFTGGAGG
jgi:predicted Zn-dependent protease